MFAVSGARSTSSLAPVKISMALISISASARIFFLVVSPKSASAVSPDESCNFGTISWHQELDDGGLDNFARFATV